MASRYDKAAGEWSFQHEAPGACPEADGTAHPDHASPEPCSISRRQLDYLELFENAPVGYMLLSASGRIERINRTGAAMLGWDAGWLAGKSFSRWVEADDKQPFLSYTQNVLKDDGPVTLELRVKKPQGRIARLRLQSVCERRYFNGDAGCRCVMIDITDEENSARKVRRLRSQLNYLGRLHTVGEMASSLAHELSQPLGSIVLNCQAAARMLKSGTGRVSEINEALSQAGDAASFASGIVRNLRGFLRNEKDHQTVCELPALVQEVSTLIAADARDSDIELMLEVDPHLRQIRVNAVQIEQVLVNLVRNSIEAMGENGGGPRRITIGAWQESSEEIRVRVADTGPGLDAKQRALMFTPRYTTKPEGMGMGLSISRTIVESHGGRLWAARESGIGAVIQFTLPVMKSEQHAH